MRNPIILGMLLLAFIYSCKKKENSPQPNQQDTTQIPSLIDDQKSLTVKPERSGEKFTFKMNGYSIVVDTALGGRITSLSIGGTEFLSQSNVDASNWGSTFWPAPQTMWSWPPPAILDSKPYSVALAGDTVILSSKTDSTKTKLQITKKISGSSVGNYMQIVYTIKNNGTAAKTVAPWEITRVDSAGVTFFPKGDTAWASPTASRSYFKDSINVVWFDYKAKGFKSDIKLFADAGSGWIAHAKGNNLLIKTFENISRSQFANKEGEVEIYASGSKPYVEVENLGAAISLQPGASINWTVKWYVVTLSEPAQAGSNSLIELVEKTIK